MKNDCTGNTSKTDWDRLDAMTDEDIDTSDIPALNAEFFERAKCLVPRPSEEITLRLDADLLDWFKSQSAAWEDRINAALRVYVETHRAARRDSAA